jgi:hypothetical protein
MPLRSFLFTVALAAGVLVAFNVFLGWRLDSVPKLRMRQMDAAPRIDYLFVGHSLMEVGLDPNVFVQALPPAQPPVCAYNIALGSTSPVEHFLLAREAYRKHAEIPHLTYGFYGLQLTENPGHGWDDLVGNRALGYETDPALAADLYAPGSAWEKWRFRCIGAVPMLRDHSQLWKYVELLRRALGQAGLPRERMNQFGRIADFARMAAPDPVKAERDCTAAMEQNAPLVPAIRALLALARERHSQVVVVEMPLATRYRLIYYETPVWRKYRDYLREKLAADGATYLVASDWVADESDFSDGLHLTPDGAKIFSARLARELAPRK